MARATGVVALQDFLDGPARPLRRTAFLLAGSWPAADEALGTALAGVLRHGADPDDHAALERDLWPALVDGLRRGQDVDLVDEHPDATEPAGRLVGALARLPFDERAAVVLAHLAHLDDAATAHALGTTPEAARSLHDKAIAALDKELARTGDRLQTPSLARADSHWRRPTTTTTTDALDA